MYACVNGWFEWTMCLSGLFSGLNAIYMTVWMDCLIWLYACLYELYICLDGLCACLDGLHLSRQTVFLSEWILNQIVYFALVVIYEMGGHTSLFLFLFLLIRLAYMTMTLWGCLICIIQVCDYLSPFTLSVTCLFVSSLTAFWNWCLFCLCCDIFYVGGCNY